MGFFSGRVTFLRYQVDGLAPELFGTQSWSGSPGHAMGRQPAADKDGD